ncbi:hypothetical protein PFFCH_03785 [Plasmodium falciparum FCH/4]|uniref:Duffy-binding-like domain-containing protein n=1 Tax=Plasmodium falciparum FCH/4 TaxID=1036724 RepID=A0A024VJV5_PLAFA|nr:hypothetical protein PFFCH_03785 [Plasmodium falciparum FCH/4]
MAPAQGGTQEQEDKYKNVKDAKELLDMIGKDVHDKVKNAAKTYEGELEGSLSQVSITSETVSSPDPCTFEYDKHTTSAKGNAKPCGNDGNNVDRFSDKQGAECSKSKIKDSKNYCGACAPFRRLHLCNKNMENMDTNNNDGKAKHNLLAEVCYAAKYEGQTIARDYPQYQQKYGDSGHTTCTMLARSFADIGDIVRGKDPFYGNTQEKEQRKKLEKNLKTIFEKIKRNNKDLKSLSLDKVREYWWALNRKDVWKAITCDDDKKLSNASYFRKTCNDSGTWSHANHKCRCQKKNGRPDDQVPTYFDYVPQYLRWFEEWAEDFCRKRKHKLKDAIKKCREGRDEKDQPIYCDLNRHDCVKTIRGDERFVEVDDCIGCHYSCFDFVKWIDKQKVEFDKQKKKYTSEISDGDSGRRRKRTKRSSSSSSSYDNGYEKKFYEKLKGTDYQNVETFLEKLSKEQICKDPPQVSGETADAADFTETKMLKTFSHTEYCQACPWCGVKEQKVDGKWEPKKEDCAKEKKTYNEKDTTTIPILTGDKTEGDMVRKYKKFCNGNGGNGREGGVGASENGAASNSDNATTGYCGGNSDSSLCEKWTYWRKELGSCIDKDKSEQCENKCNSKCDCFLQWVNEKKTEWKAIKDHFRKQEDIADETGMDPGVTLEYLLKKEILLKSIEDTHANAKDIDRIGKMLNDEETSGASSVSVTGGANGQNSIIDKLLNHEEKEAKQCKETHTKDKCDKPQQSAGDGVARSAGPPPAEKDASSDEVPDDNSDEDEDDEDDDDVLSSSDEDEEEEEEEGDEDGEEDNTVDGESEPPATKDVVKPPCDIVDELFKDDNTLKNACPTKYGSKAPTSWKCVTPSGNTSETTTDKGGGVCIPPRRRKLYTQKIKEWAEKNSALSSETPQGETSSQSEAQTASDRSAQTASQPNSHPASPSNPRDVDGLRDAFIQSAAIETFFLWDRYKKENTKKTQSGSQLQTLGGSVDDDDKDPQNELQESGKIPPDFLRQMFYTLADYKDILERKNDIVIDKKTGDKEMKAKEEKIKGAIQKFFENGDSQPPSGKPVPQNSGKDPETWWKEHGVEIWKGMLCALCYDTKTKEKNDTVKNALFKNDGTLKNENYKYETVTFEGGFNSDKKTTATITKLEEFSRRPQYFRWLEEWGDEFCRKRTHKLDIIEKECYKDGDKNCSGDGLKCKEIVIDKEKIFEDFLCPTCGRHCRSYRKWIQRKKTEYEKQKEEYSKQKGNVESNKDDYKEFSKTLGNYNDAASFLKTLGPCKKDNASGEDKKGDLYIKFDEDKSFKHTDYCDSCSEFIVKCENGNCSKDKEQECKNKNSITANDIETMGKPTEINMLVSDNGATEFNDLQPCKNAGIFRGFRNDVWKCGEYCGVDICTLKKTNNGEGKEHIIVKELLKRWLEYFFEDYNKINKKLNSCMNKGEQSPCIKGCVDEWIKLKKDEWQKINRTYLKKYTENNGDDGNTLTNFLEQYQHLTEFQKAIKPCKTVSDFDSKRCNANASTEKENGKKIDIVECLIEKLRKEAKKCEETQAKCENASIPLPNEEEEIPEENPVTQPNICPAQQPEDQTEETCEEPKQEKEKKESEERKDTSTSGGEGSATPELPVPTTENSETNNQTPKDPAKDTKDKGTNPPVSGDKKKGEPPIKLLDDPLVIPALVTSTLAWSVGIGFAAFTYFYLKVLYIYMWMWMYMYVWVCLDVYICICVSEYLCVGVFGYICVYMYVFYIYFIYIYLY